MADNNMPESGEGGGGIALRFFTREGLPAVVWLVPVLGLLVACVPVFWPDWYYAALRWVSSLCFLAILVAEYRSKKAERTPWMLLYLFLLVIFNPFYVMSFTEQLHWIMMDVLGIVILLIHWLELRRLKKAS